MGEDSGGGGLSPQIEKKQETADDYRSIDIIT